MKTQRDRMWKYILEQEICKPEILDIMVDVFGYSKETLDKIIFWYDGKYFEENEMSKEE